MTLFRSFSGRAHQLCVRHRFCTIKLGFNYTKSMSYTGCGRNNSHIWRGHCSGCGGGTVMEESRWLAVVLLFLSNAMSWSGEQGGFVVETFIKNNESVIATQRAFRRHFRLGRCAPVPDRKTILLWVSNMRATGSTLKRKPPGPPRSRRTPENVQTLSSSIAQSPRLSARKHAAALRISDRSVRRMLHQEPGMHPYKMMLAQ